MSVVLAPSSKPEQAGAEHADMSSKGKANTERGAAAAGASGAKGAKRAKRMADNRRDGGSLAAERAALPLHLMSALAQASTGTAAHSGRTGTGSGGAAGAAAGEDADRSDTLGAVRSDADAASTSAKLFDELSAQLAAWSSRAPAAVPSGVQPGAEAACGEGANGGGKWRRVHEWQPCPIGVILGNVSPHPLCLGFRV